MTKKHRGALEDVSPSGLNVAYMRPKGESSKTEVHKGTSNRREKRTKAAPSAEKTKAQTKPDDSNASTSPPLPLKGARLPDHKLARYSNGSEADHDFRSDLKSFHDKWKDEIDQGDLESRIIPRPENASGGGHNHPSRESSLFVNQSETILEDNEAKRERPHLATLQTGVPSLDLLESSETSSPAKGPLGCGALDDDANPNDLTEKSPPERRNLPNRGSAARTRSPNSAPLPCFDFAIMHSPSHLAPLYEGQVQDPGRGRRTGTWHPFKSHLTGPQQTDKSPSAEMWLADDRSLLPAVMRPDPPGRESRSFDQEKTAALEQEQPPELLEAGRELELHGTRFSSTCAQIEPSGYGNCSPLNKHTTSELEFLQESLAGSDPVARRDARLEVEHDPQASDAHGGDEMRLTADAVEAKEPREERKAAPFGFWQPNPLY